MLERGFLLPNHDFKKPNAKIPWKEWNLSVPKTQRPWPKGKKYISISNFGFGGTNAHAVLEKAPFNAPGKKPSMSRRTTTTPGEGEEKSGKRRMFVLTGNDKQSLEGVMNKLVVYLEQRPELVGFPSSYADYPARLTPPLQNFPVRPTEQPRIYT